MKQALLQWPEEIEGACGWRKRQKRRRPSSRQPRRRRTSSSADQDQGCRSGRERHHGRCVSLKQMAAGLAEGHDLPKRQVETMLGELVQSFAEHLQRAPRSGSRPRHLPGELAGRADGSQSGNRRADPDQSQQEDRFPPGQGAQGGDLIGAGRKRRVRPSAARGRGRRVAGMVHMEGKGCPMHAIIVVDLLGYTILNPAQAP